MYLRFHKMIRTVIAMESAEAPGPQDANLETEVTALRGQVASLQEEMVLVREQLAMIANGINTLLPR